MLTVMKGPHLVSAVTLTFRVRGGESPVIPAGPEGVTFLGTGYHGDWLSSYFWYESLTVHVSPQEKERVHMSGQLIRGFYMWEAPPMRVCYSSQPIGSGVKWGHPISANNKESTWCKLNNWEPESLVHQKEQGSSGVKQSQTNRKHCVWQLNQ